MTSAQLNALLAVENAGWRAGETSLSQLPPDEQNRHLGYNPDGGELSLALREQAALTRRAAAGGSAGSAAGAPASFDWRNVGGNNYITPIRDQSSCGCCVAFGVTAAVEGMVRAQRNEPNLAVDLSEAALFFCSGGAQGRTCGTGWWAAPALDAFKNEGVPDEACFPYSGHDQACNRCADWQNRVTKISGWHTIGDVGEIKAWLSSRGPLCSCLTVYSDFYSYASGVYRHVSGGVVCGGQYVCVVGYDDAQGCWICKMSWGTGWGDSGFFRIAYGECGIDATMWAIDGVIYKTWIDAKLILGLWANDQDRNGWVYVQDAGWKKISPDNDNVFFDMFAQLGAAKSAGRPVNLFDDNGVIKQIYVL